MRLLGKIIPNLFALLLFGFFSFQGLFGAQRMGLIPGVKTSIPPGKHKELSARCMDEHADAPLTTTDYSQVFNSNPGDVSITIKGKSIPLQEALDNGYVSISGVTSPQYGFFQARIDAVKISNHTNGPIGVEVNKSVILGESNHKPLHFDPSWLKSEVSQRDLWNNQVSFEKNANQQERLRNLGIYKTEIDGRANSTSLALKEFQKANSIPQTGKFDHATEDRIGVVAKEKVARIEKIADQSRILGVTNPPNPSKFAPPEVRLRDYYRDFQVSHNLEGHGLINEATTNKLKEVDRRQQQQIELFQTTFERLGYRNTNAGSFEGSIRDYQTTNSIRQSGVLDRPTRGMINAEIDAYKKKLEVLGFGIARETDLSQAISWYQIGRTIPESRKLDFQTKTQIQKEINEIEKSLALLGYGRKNQTLLGNRVRKFQEDRSILSNGRFDSRTKEAVKNDMDELHEKFLYVTGLKSSDLSIQINHYQSLKGIYGKNHATKRIRKELDRDYRSKNFINHDGRILKTEEIYFGKKNHDNVESERCIKIQKGISARFSSEPMRTRNLIQNQLSRQYDPDDIKILSLVKDPATSDALKEFFPENMVKFNFKSSKSLEKGLKKNEGSTVFALGHIENGKFVTRDAQGQSIYEVEVNELIQMGKNNGVDIFPLGCNSAKYSSSGMTKDIYSAKVTKELGQAIKNNGKFGDILSEFAGERYQLIIDESTFSGQDFTKIPFYEKSIIKGDIIIVPIGYILLPLLAYNSSDDDGDE